ncbi:MAG: hypothetical protein QM627_06970 [Luteolibacter sp.]
MARSPYQPGSKSLSRHLVRAALICGGCVAILLPAWLPNRPGVPLTRGTVELLQALLLVAGAAVMLGASPHTGPNRPICRAIALCLFAAVVGEIEDFFWDFLQIKLPEGEIICVILAIALVTCLRHKRTVLRFGRSLGSHTGTGFIGAALLILYVFNRVMGSAVFWKASLGDAFAPEIPRICKSYLELLACYLIFVGTLGLAISLARRPEPE